MQLPCPGRCALQNENRNAVFTIADAVQYCTPGTSGKADNQDELKLEED